MGRLAILRRSESSLRRLRREGTLRCTVKEDGKSGVFFLRRYVLKDSDELDRSKQSVASAMSEPYVISSGGWDWRRNVGIWKSAPFRLAVPLLPNFGLYASNWSPLALSFGPSSLPSSRGEMGADAPVMYLIISQEFVFVK